jgi:hypothetical protein
MEVQLHTFLTSLLDGVEWSASHPARFTPGEGTPDICWRLGGPQNRPGSCGNKKNRTPTGSGTRILLLPNESLSLQHDQMGSGSHSASYPMGSGYSGRSVMSIIHRHPGRLHEVVLQH